MECQFAVLKYVQRHSVHNTHDDDWGVVRPISDGAPQFAWETLSQRHVSLEVFFACRRELFGMFVNIDDVRAIERAKPKYESASAEVMRVVEGPAAGRSIFKAAWLQASKAIYQEQIVEHLRDLEHLDSPCSEVESFQLRMVEGACALSRTGRTKYTRAIKAHLMSTRTALRRPSNQRMMNGNFMFRTDHDLGQQFRIVGASVVGTPRE